MIWNNGLSPDLQIQAARIGKLNELLNSVSGGASRTVFVDKAVSANFTDTATTDYGYAYPHFAKTVGAVNGGSGKSVSQVLNFAKQNPLFSQDGTYLFFAEVDGVLMSFSDSDLTGEGVPVGPGVTLEDPGATQFSFLQIVVIDGVRQLFAYPSTFKSSLNIGKGLSSKSYEMYIGLGGDSRPAWLFPEEQVANEITAAETRISNYINALFADSIVPVDSVRVISKTTINGNANLIITDYSQGEYEAVAQSPQPSDFGSGLFAAFAAGDPTLINWDIVLTEFGDFSAYVIDENWDTSIHFRRAGLLADGVSKFPITHVSLSTQNYGFNPANSVHILSYDTNADGHKIFRDATPPKLTDGTTIIPIDVPVVEPSVLTATLSEARLVSAVGVRVLIGGDSIALLPNDYNVLITGSNAVITISAPAKKSAIWLLASTIVGGVRFGASIEVSYKRRV